MCYPHPCLKCFVFFLFLLRSACAFAIAAGCFWVFLGSGGVWSESWIGRGLLQVFQLRRCTVATERAETLGSTSKNHISVGRIDDCLTVFTEKKQTWHFYYHTFILFRLSMVHLFSDWTEIRESVMNAEGRRQSGLLWVDARNISENQCFMNAE